MSDNTAQPSPRKPRRTLAELSAEIIERLGPGGVIDCYREIGVQFDGDAPKADGRFPCYGLASLREDGRADSDPSAYVDVRTGRYKDSGGAEPREINLWDVAAKAGMFAGDWKAARRYYAERAGVELPAERRRGARGKGSASRSSAAPGQPAAKTPLTSRKPAERSDATAHTAPTARPTRQPAENPDDVLTFEDWTDGQRARVALWAAKHKRGVTVEAIEAAGGRVGNYHERCRIVGVPIYGPELLAAPPVGWVIWSLNPGENGSPLVRKDKATDKWVELKMKTVGSADGVIGRHGLERLAGSADVLSGRTASTTIDTAYKVEGPTDLLALFAAMPAATRDANPILSFAGGATQCNPWQAALFAGHYVTIVGDRDKAGEAGAAKCSNMIGPLVAPATSGPLAGSPTTVVVPTLDEYPLEPKHGRDLRDWLNDGHTFDELRSRASFCEPWSAPVAVEDLPDGAYGMDGDGEGGFGEGEGADGGPSDLTPIEAVDDPHRLARDFMDRYGSHNGVPSVYHWRQGWHAWNGLQYRELGDGEINKMLNRSIKEEFDRLNLLAQEKFNERDVTDDNADDSPPVAHKVSCALVTNVAAAIAGMHTLPDDRDAPFWVNPALYSADAPPPSADQLLVTGSGVIHVPSLATDAENCVSPLTPNLFTPNAVAYKFPEDNPRKCPPPVHWYQFLDSLWGEDYQSISLLQEWFGYCLLPDTSQQKIMMLLGPPRSGKGTIFRTLTELVGSVNVVNPKLHSLGGDFGLEPLIGKSLAIITDAKLSGRSDLAQILESLLSISGEDGQTINRKNRPAINTRLRIRFMMGMNELPRLDDSSGAFMQRCLLLKTTESFVGREDRSLESKLRSEMPSILIWALQGYRRLAERTYFEQAEAGKETLAELRILTSPIKAFLDDCCEVAPDGQCMVDDAYKQYRTWCEEQGRKPAAKNVFGRDIHAAAASVRTEQIWNKGDRSRAFIGLKLRPTIT